MDTYRELYYHLFHVNETALRALERSDVSGAVRILSAGQREAEEAVLSDSFQSVLFPGCGAGSDA